MNLFREHIASLPDLIASTLADFDAVAHDLFCAPSGWRPARVHLIGCGDSNYAGVCARMAFHELAGIACEPHTAMEFARYVLTSPVSSGAWMPGDLVIGVSVSGGVSRTIEGVMRARTRGLLTVALTSSSETPLARAAERLLLTHVPDLPDARGTLVPGSRSFYASLVMLMLTAVALGEQRGALDAGQAALWRSRLHALPSVMRREIAAAEGAMRALADETRDESAFAFAGSGPNFGSAQFSAAKLIEACGDVALAQDIEEWAHVGYWARRPATPTFLFAQSADDTRSFGTWRSASRAEEVDAAMRALGRRVVRAPTEPVAEVLSPLLACLAPMLFAAHRAAVLGEPYFRAFGGGRSLEGGGGANRIRTSAIEPDPAG